MARSGVQLRDRRVTERLLATVSIVAGIGVITARAHGAPVPTDWSTVQARVRSPFAQTGGSTPIPRCPRGEVDNYLSPSTQQCWFDSPRGRWRTLGHELHYYSLVVEVEATSFADADEIARRFVKRHGKRFTEIMVYVQEESALHTSTIRRVRWTRRAGFDTLEFEGSLRR